MNANEENPVLGLMEEHRRLLRLFIPLLLFSHLLPSRAAAPLPGISLSSKNEYPSGGNVMDQRAKEEARDQMMEAVEEQFATQRRMDLVSNDYPGSGANNRHDPKTPGRA